MKLVKKALLILSVGSLLLTACDYEKRVFCVETYDQADYLNGYCMQLSRKDINETAYVFILPLNPDDPDENYQYEITWNSIQNKKYYTFTHGLEGKKVDSVSLVNLHNKNKAVKINLHGECKDDVYTSGYLRISREAFTANSEESRDAYLYAFFKVGDKTGVLPKPANYKF